MINHNIRFFAYTILGLAFAIFIIIVFATQDLSSIKLQGIGNAALTSISINIILWVVFIKWAWKLPVFYPWLVKIPNLSGKWDCLIKTTWEGQEKDVNSEVIIQQSFFHIQVKLETGESKSYTISSSFDIDIERGTQQLLYSYLNTPKVGVRDRSTLHYGTVRLDFNGRNVDKMQGEYWTSRQSVGDMELTRHVD